MRINYNISAITTNNVLKKNDDALTNSMERLSSGFKINHAKDNPAGLAISKRMNAQLEGLSVANQNSSDGISVIQTAEGSLSEIQSMLQRMNELAVQASNGTVTSADRAAIQQEVSQLKAEITRISRDTEFNGQALLDGSFDLKGYSDNASVEVVSYSDAVPPAVYQLVNIVPGYLDGATGEYVPPTADLLDSTGTAVPGITLSGEGDTLTMMGENDFELDIYVDPAMAAPFTAELDVTGIGAMRLQIGSNEGQVLNVRIPEVTVKSIGIEAVDVSTLETARASLDLMPDAINFISEVRSRLGAYENRLEHTTSSLDVSHENLTAAYSRIMDTDMASEMTEYTKLQVLSEAGISMLAQANERPQQALQLLQ